MSLLLLENDIADDAVLLEDDTDRLTLEDGGSIPVRNAVWVVSVGPLVWRLEVPATKWEIGVPQL